MRILFLLVLIGLNHILPGQSPLALEVVVNNVKSNQGSMKVALFNSEKGFTGNPWKGIWERAQAGTMRITFHDISPGNYAIAVYHDANDNGKLDSNFFGKPKEGFGFSRDAMGTFGPPSFDKALISWTGSEIFTINLRYY